MSDDKPRVERATLAKVIADWVRSRIPHAAEWVVVKRKGRMEVEVKVKVDPQQTPLVE